jgi:hypothetical protein
MVHFVFFVTSLLLKIVVLASFTQPQALERYCKIQTSVVLGLSVLLSGLIYIDIGRVVYETNAAFYLSKTLNEKAVQNEPQHFIFNT